MTQFFQLILTCWIKLIEGKSSKCGHTDCATCVVWSSQMCQLTMIDENQASMDTALNGTHYNFTIFFKMPFLLFDL